MRSTSPLLPGRQHPKGRQARNEAQPANAPHPLMECKPAVIYLIDYCQTDTPPPDQTAGVPSKMRSSLVSDLLWLKALHEMSTSSRPGDYSRYFVHAPVWAMRELQAYASARMDRADSHGNALAPRYIVDNVDVRTGEFSPSWEPSEKRHSATAQTDAEIRALLPILCRWRIWIEDTTAALSRDLLRHGPRNLGESPPAELEAWLHDDPRMLGCLRQIYGQVHSQEADQPEGLVPTRLGDSVARILAHVTPARRRAWLSSKNHKALAAYADR